MANNIRCPITMSDRAIESIYQSVKERLHLTFDEFKEALKDWDFVELTEQDQLIGAVMIKDNELHVGYSQKPTASIRGHIKKTLSELIEKYGSAVTSVTKGNEKGLKFCKRIGFEIVGEDQGKIYMKCDRCNYVLK